ncbi:TetR/AcrR family transcriptional regulator [Nonomuraea soli]|uniref:AcrR family transcriptional regulator n=1 Tax=Nonomuraea soli TaxID=1032476 RepID=A0A7W0HUC4_9ACTN|nr:TetR/AcrR family transcriptional regulator [Nonomuraea soli]MBA2895960.1 AcrR family transcriptional regulator [Nonomuraea soli]
MAPLDPDRERAIIDATLELLSEVGYDRMTVDGIAKRARASKATLYRRWAGKPELVVDVICSRFQLDVPVVEPTGSLRDDLLTLVRGLCDMIERKHGLIIGLSSTIVSNQELARALRSHMPVKDIGGAAALLERAGYGQADPSRLYTVAEALVWHRMIFIGPSFDDAFVADTVDGVLVPLVESHKSV